MTCLAPAGKQPGRTPGADETDDNDSDDETDTGAGESTGRPATTPSLFDLGPVLSIRTPRRRTESGVGYAAQLWCEAGYWCLGVYATTAEARRAARRFAAEEPRAPAAGTPRSELPEGWSWKRREVEDADGRPRWVRRVKGGGYQARFWLEVIRGSLNLGIFTLAEHDYDWRAARWAAGRAAKEFRRLWQGKTTVGEAVALLQQKKPLPWVSPDVRVPEKWRDLTLPNEYGPTEFAGEKRARERAEREARRYKLTLFGPWEAVFGEGDGEALAA